MLKFGVIPVEFSPNGNEGLQDSVAVRGLVPWMIGVVARSFTVIAVGEAGVSVLLMRSCWAESEMRPLGVSLQEQHETSSSAGSKVYTFTQILPVL